MNIDVDHLVYVVGVFLLGAVYLSVKGIVGNDYVLIVGVIIYLLILRLIGRVVDRKYSRKSQR